MARKIINKRSDPQVLQLRKIRDGKDRSLVFCEGEKLVEELFQSDWRPRSLFCTSDKIQIATRLVHATPSIPVAVLSDDVMKFCSDLTTPQGLIALAKPPEYPVSFQSNAGAVLGLVIHGVQLPQNVGALLRAAEGAGVTDVYSSASSADPWGPKALRGSSGSVFRMPVRRLRSLGEIIEQLRARGIKSAAATQYGKLSYDKMDWTRSVALVMGSEGAGFSDDELKLFDQTITIPMKGKVESLNVATAAAVCLFEAARQRSRGN